MIQVGVMTGGAEEHLGVDGAYRFIKEIGFDAVDAGICNAFPEKDVRSRVKPAAFTGSEQDLLELFRPWKDASKKYGLPNFQAHAPVPTCVLHDSEYDAFLLECLKKIVRACDDIDCRRLVVHPYFFGYQDQLDPAEEWDINIERYASLIPVAKEYGVTICLENMFMEYRGKIYEACCADICKACAYVDTLNGLAGGRQFGFCLDTGHLLLCSKDVRIAMDMLGDRICAFHMHDNDGIRDRHLAPGMGILDWSRFVQGLHDIHYNSTISFETHKLWNWFKEEDMPDVMHNLLLSGRKIAAAAMK